MAEPRLVALPSLDELYTVGPEDFVAARNALAKELKAAGDKDTAAEVAKLRRPPVSAWALNQVARHRPDDVAALLDAASALAEALAAPGDHDVRAAQRGFRGTIEAVVRAATDVVTASGRTPSPSFQQVAQATLQAAAVDDGIASTLRAGVLAEDEPAPGFVFAAGAVPAATRAAATKGSPTKRAATKGTATKAGRTTTTSTAPGRKLAAVPDPPAPSVAERRAEERERARAEAEQREADRQRRLRLNRLRADVDRLEKRAARLAAQADQAEERAAAARDDADAARREADRSKAALDAAERS